MNASHHRNQNHVLPLYDDIEFLEDFQEAIKDPEKRKQIISVLEKAELLPLSARLPA